MTGIEFKSSDYDWLSSMKNFTDKPVLPVLIYIIKWSIRDCLNNAVSVLNNISNNPTLVSAM